MQDSSHSKTVFDVLLKDTSARRMGDFTLLNLGGNNGAIFISNQEFISSRKWAHQHYATRNAQHDLQLYLAHLACYVSRRGAGIQAKGSTAHLLRLARAMPALGLEWHDWNFPETVQDELDRTA